jgi:hypothetical protein
LHPYWAFCTKNGVRMIDRIDAQRIERLNAPQPEGQSTEWLDVAANNYGFFSKHDYPYLPANDKDFLLGVFGGSVAQWFCLQQGRAFAEELAANLSEYRRVEILNFGLGAFKQPQSMLTFAYFLVLGQQFDAVLLLDGFNDAALSWINASRGTACALPTIAYADMFRDSACLFELKVPERSVSDRVNEIASLWEEGARMMREACSERRIPFFHVLQPNQYYSRKPFSEEEHSIALSHASPYREGVTLLYPELANRMRKMRGSVCNVFDATGIFDDQTETVYSDNCCHYNRLGNEILGKFILTGMLEKRARRGLECRGGRRLRGRGIQGWIRDWFPPRNVVRPKAPSDPAGEGTAKDDLYPMW